MMTREKAPTKHQLKSEATRNALLEAAEAIFSRDGYERAQIDEIAKQSGRTRGAVYAQYKTKEQLFFALQDQRINSAAEKMRTAVAKHPGDVGQSLQDLRKLYSDLDHSDAEILDLELKLYAVRNPDCREKWRNQYANLFSGTNSQEFKQVFGVGEESGRAHIRNRILALSAVKSGLVLAMRFMPQEMTASQTSMLLRQVFDGLFPPHETTERAKPARSKPAMSKPSTARKIARKKGSK